MSTSALSVTNPTLTRTKSDSKINVTDIEMFNLLFDDLYRSASVSAYDSVSSPDWEWKPKKNLTFNGTASNNQIDLRKADIYGPSQVNVLVDGKLGQDNLIISEKIGVYYSGRDFFSNSAPPPNDSPMVIWSKFAQITLKNVETVEIDDGNKATPNLKYSVPGDGNIIGTDQNDALGVLQSGATMTGRGGRDRFDLRNFAHMELDYGGQVFPGIWITMRHVDILDFEQGKDKIVVTRDLKPLVEERWAGTKAFQLTEKTKEGMSGYINLHIQEDWNIGVYTNAAQINASDFVFV